jgi:cell division protein FtsL
MSTAAGSAFRSRPTHETRPEPRHRLRAVTPARRASRLPFLVLSALVVVAGVLGLVSLNVSVNQQAFAIAKLQRSTRDAEVRYAGLQAEVDRLKSPDRIAREAARRHLQPAGRPRVERWPASRAGDQTSPGAATSPAAPGARTPTSPSGNAQAWPEDPFPLKQYLAEP